MRKLLVLIAVVMLVGGMAHAGSKYPLYTDGNGNPFPYWYYTTDTKAQSTVDTSAVLYHTYIDGMSGVTSYTGTMRSVIAQSIGTTAILLGDYTATATPAIDTVLVVYSSSYADSDVSGTAAQRVRITTVDGALSTRTNMDIALRGTVVCTSATTARYIESAQVVDVGSNAANLGTITIGNQYFTDTYLQIGNTYPNMKCDSSRRAILNGATAHIYRYVAYNLDETESVRVMIMYAHSDGYDTTRFLIKSFEVRATELMDRTFKDPILMTGPGLIEIWAQAVSGNISRLEFEYDIEEP